MKTMRPGLIALMMVFLLLQVTACEEDSDDGGTTDEDGDEQDDDDDDDTAQEDGDEDGDEETIDCLSLTEEDCEEHSEECRTYLARRYTLREDGCLYYQYDANREFASCGSLECGSEDVEINVLSPNDEYWYFSDTCIPEGWIDLYDDEDICETRDCPTEPFCHGPIADGDEEATE